MPFNPLFLGTSSEIPELIKVSFPKEPTGNQLGAQLKNHDKGLTEDMFKPSYASVLKLVEGETVALKKGVASGDYIVAVNGVGFRRFSPDYYSANARRSCFGIYIGGSGKVPFDELDGDVKLNRVVSGLKDGEAYAQFLSSVKKARCNDDELTLVLERFSWDSRANSWPRFMKARDGDIVEAMKMLQDHEYWRDATFPLDLTTVSFQKLLKSNVFSYPALRQLDETLPLVLSVNFSLLQSLNCSTSDISNALILFMETLLARSINTQSPKLSCFIDVSNVFYNRIRPDILRKIYSVFEPNYPETLHKMVIYPVTKYLVDTASALLTFVNRTTKSKIIITDDLDILCQELGWSKEEIECCGGTNEYLKKYQIGNSNFVFD